MKRSILSFVLAALLFTIPGRSFAWGKKGHELVAEIAFHFLDDSTKMIVKQYLGNITIEEAAVWMDDSRSNSFYDFMKPWHYLDMDKGETWKGGTEKNILTILHSAILELRQYKTLKRKDIKRDLLLIFHLVGDLHQPLHTGYAVDKGGNTIEISSQNFSSNLHSAWDTQIIESEGISLDNCLKEYESLTREQIDTIKKINELKWMYQSRSLLDSVYNFQKGFLDRHYVESSSEIIKKQLVMGGLRLASILSDIFNPNKVEAQVNYQYNFWGLVPVSAAVNNKA